jgi:glutamate synthase domain-containing protein 3
MSIAMDARKRDVLTITKDAGPVAAVINAAGHSLKSLNGQLKEALSNGRVLIQEAAHLDGMAAGLESGEVIIEGDSGDYLAVLNDGATIHLTGNAGSYLADNMTRGTVIVDGDAGYAAAPYCYGGTVVVDGEAGDFTAVMNKGATILVRGKVGDEVATYMLAGDLIICGDSGKNLGNYLIRGNIYVGGEWESLGNNTRVEEITEADLAKLRGYFDEYHIDADPATFRKIVPLSEKPFYKSKAPVQPTPLRK